MGSRMDSAVMPLWQEPYVDVIKYGMTHRNVGWHSQGHVKQIQDKFIHCNVFKIRGAIAAMNYLRVPRDTAKGTHGLGLAGRFVYFQVRQIGDLPLTIHLDVISSKKTPVRVTLSSISRTIRRSGTVFHVPLSLDARWTVVVLDMVRLVELHSFNQYGRDAFHHLKSITLCASMNVRKLFVSPTLYTPTTLPRSLRLPGEFGHHYCWLLVPLDGSSLFHHDRQRQHDLVKKEELRIAMAPKPGRRVRETKCSLIPKERKRDGFKDASARQDQNEILFKTDQASYNAGVLDTGSNGAASPSSIDAASLPSFAAICTRRMKRRHCNRSCFSKSESPDPVVEVDRITGFSNSFPRTLLWLPDGSACVYTSSSTIIYQEMDNEKTARDRSDRSHGSCKDTDEYSSTKGTRGRAIGTREHFLFGHCAPICALALTTDGSLMASAEEKMPKDCCKKPSDIRLWDLARLECITVIEGQPNGVHGLCFSAALQRRLILCVVGYDEWYRTQILLWDCSAFHLATKNKEKNPAVVTRAARFLGRQTSSFPIDRIAFSPYEQQEHEQFHLVSCGRENVRFWRVNLKTGHLSGRPVILNEHAREAAFTDIGFDARVDIQSTIDCRVRSVYVVSSMGTLLVINYDLRQLIAVYQLHHARINCLCVHESFCVTGSDDCLLRVWPLDFSKCMLEVQLETGVISLDRSGNGMNVLVGSRNNVIGVLNIADQHFVTMQRCHLEKIPSASWDISTSVKSELVTASSDGTLRGWDTSSGHQIYALEIQNERVTSLMASPVDRGIIAVGFASGYTRIYGISRSRGFNRDDAPFTMLYEFRQHRSSIQYVAFDTELQHVYTSGAGKAICLYDTRRHDKLPVKMVLADMDPDDGYLEFSQDKKWMAVVSGDRQQIVLFDPYSLRMVSMVQPPKQGQIERLLERLQRARFSKNSRELLVLSATDELYRFSLPERNLLQSLTLFGQGGISALTLSSNSNYLFTGGFDRSLLRVWNWQESDRSDCMFQSSHRHAGKVEALTFTKDGKSIMSTEESHTVCSWQFHGDVSLRKHPS